MTHQTLTVMRAEHQALSAMLTSMSMLLTEYRRRGSSPDFGVLRVGCRRTCTGVWPNCVLKL